MRTRFAVMLPYILSSIYRAEANVELKTGVNKQEQVLHDVHLKAYQLGFLPSTREPFPKEIIQAIIAVIDAIVHLLNLLGIFKNANRGR